MNEYYDFFKDFAGVTAKDLEQYKKGGKTCKAKCGKKMKKLEDGSIFGAAKKARKKVEDTITSKVANMTGSLTGGASAAKTGSVKPQNISPANKATYDQRHSKEYYDWLKKSSQNSIEEANEEAAAVSAGLLPAKKRNKKK